MLEKVRRPIIGLQQRRKSTFLHPIAGPHSYGAGDSVLLEWTPIGARAGCGYRQARHCTGPRGRRLFFLRSAVEENLLMCGYWPHCGRVRGTPRIGFTRCFRSCPDRRSSLADPFAGVSSDGLPPRRALVHSAHPALRRESPRDSRRSSVAPTFTHHCHRSVRKGTKRRAGRCRTHRPGYEGRPIVHLFRGGQGVAQRQSERLTREQIHNA